MYFGIPELWITTFNIWPAATRIFLNHCYAVYFSLAMRKQEVKPWLYEQFSLFSKISSILPMLCIMELEVWVYTWSTCSGGWSYRKQKSLYSLDSRVLDTTVFSAVLYLSEDCETCFHHPQKNWRWTWFGLGRWENGTYKWRKSETQFPQSMGLAVIAVSSRESMIRPFPLFQFLCNTLV